MFWIDSKVRLTKNTATLDQTLPLFRKVSKTPHSTTVHQSRLPVSLAPSLLCTQYPSRRRRVPASWQAVWSSPTKNRIEAFQCMTHTNVTQRTQQAIKLSLCVSSPHFHTLHDLETIHRASFLPFFRRIAFCRLHFGVFLCFSFVTNTDTQVHTLKSNYGRKKNMTSNSSCMLSNVSGHCRRSLLWTKTHQ